MFLLCVSHIVLPRARFPSTKRINDEAHHSIAKTRKAIKAILAGLPPGSVQAHIQAIMMAILSGYRSRTVPTCQPIQNHPSSVVLTGRQLSPALQVLVDDIIHDLAHRWPMVAANEIATIYETLLPLTTKKEKGIFYTPPGLAYSLIRHLDVQGVDWVSAKVLEPACGAGLLFFRLMNRKLQALSNRKPAQKLKRLAQDCLALDTDPFAVFLCQSLIEIMLHDLCQEAGMSCPTLVRVASFLDEEFQETAFDVIAGNPPFGVVSLDPKERLRDRNCLEGRTNLYARFLVEALHRSGPTGVVSMIIPTSLISSHSFRGLRRFIREETKPASLDIIEDRKAVFEGVNQETMILTLRKDKKPGFPKVYSTDIDGKPKLWRGPLPALPKTSPDFERDQHFGNTKTPIGRVYLPEILEAPWFLPRKGGDEALIKRLIDMPDRLSTWGLKVSTGSFLWNQWKHELRKVPSVTTVPLIYAKAIVGNRLTTHKIAGKPVYLDGVKITHKDLLVDKPCILIRRTTSKEQARRLSATWLDEDFLRSVGGQVAIENHVNVLTFSNPDLTQDHMPNFLPIRLSTLVWLLNSKVVDEVYRCQSGANSVSAFELMNLPLPSLDEMLRIERMINSGLEPEQIEEVIEAAYRRPLSCRSRAIASRANSDNAIG